MTFPVEADADVEGAVPAPSAACIVQILERRGFSVRVLSARGMLKVANVESVNRLLVSHGKALHPAQDALSVIVESTRSEESAYKVAINHPLVCIPLNSRHNSLRLICAAVLPAQTVGNVPSCRLQDDRPRVNFTGLCCDDLGDIPILVSHAASYGPCLIKDRQPDEGHVSPDLVEQRDQ